ncbi:MAG: nuclear transport factor 2 family protein [Pyrinomonadaceae bacterium]
MKVILPLFLLIIFAVFAFGQPKKSNLKTNNNLQTLVETEQAFAKTAELKGTKAAFLVFLADDGIVFNPTETNGKLFWQNRPESPAWLNWSPNWADISSDGNLGYTTGGWSFHPKGKTGEATAFGDYFTIWKKQADGKFKAVVDMGISHKKPLSEIKNWKSPADAGTGATKVEAGINNGILTDIFSKEMLSQGYFNYFADDVVILRDGFEPFHGKTNAFAGLEKVDKQFPPKSYLDFKANVSQIYGNMMYSQGIYQLTHKDKTISSWNFLQVWKNRNGKWQIIADVFTEIPKDKSN